MKQESDWEAYVQFNHNPPRLMMRRKVNDCWQYREPTAKEYEDHMSAEAW